jgi:cell division protein FtsB
MGYETDGVTFVQKLALEIKKLAADLEELKKRVDKLEGK